MADYGSRQPQPNLILYPSSAATFENLAALSHVFLGRGAGLETQSIARIHGWILQNMGPLSSSNTALVTK